MVDFEFTEESEDWLRDVRDGDDEFIVYCENCMYREGAPTKEGAEKLKQKHENDTADMGDRHTAVIDGADEYWSRR